MRTLLICAWVGLALCAGPNPLDILIAFVTMPFVAIAAFVLLFIFTRPFP